jgi:hypothetical protein
MAICWLPSQMPELKRIPNEMRDELVETALYSVPISPWHLFTCAAVMYPLVFAGIYLVVTFSTWYKYFYLCVAFPIGWVWWLNSARPRIRELVEDILRQRGECSSVKAD